MAHASHEARRDCTPAGTALSSGCAHQQLTNRQVAVGVIGAAAVVLIIVMLSTQCDQLDPNDCSFQ